MGILKEGFQTIIPREASRSILLGEASYTLIDDSGIQFFLSPMDKRKRRLEGKTDTEDSPPPTNKRQERKPQREDIILEEEEEDCEEFAVREKAKNEPLK